MCKEVMVDLKINRKEHGLSNRDMAHLLDTDSSRISRLEQGDARPSVSEICLMSLVYGKTPDQLFRLTVRKLLPILKQRLSAMPTEPVRWEKYHDRRLETLNDLFERLQILTSPKDAA